MHFIFEGLFILSGYFIENDIYVNGEEVRGENVINKVLC